MFSGSKIYIPVKNSDEPKTVSLKKGGKYVNVYKDWPFSFCRGIFNFIVWLVRLKLKFFEEVDYKMMLPVYRPYFTSNYSEVTEDIRATWLGHASVYLEIDGMKVLLDPVFSQRCPAYVGPSRYRPCPVMVEDIESLDLVLISHNHYDHMDSSTVRALGSRFPDLQWVVPEGDKTNVEEMLDKKTGYYKVQELDWWQEYIVTVGEKKLTIVFTPTQHWSNRGILDTFKSLWGSYVLIGSKSRFWFGGDTGYCPAFKEIGDAYGPFDCAAIPIGAYEPRYIMQYQHVSPNESLKIHRDIGSRLSFGIHWGTFVLTEEEHLAPRDLINQLVKERQTNDTDPGEQCNFITINHGETILTTDGRTHRVIRGDVHPAN